MPDFSLLSFVAFSCKEDVDVNGSDTDYSAINGNYGFVRNASGSEQLYNISIYGDKSSTSQLYYELSKPGNSEVNITFTMSQTVLDAYNAANKTEYVMYPSSLVTFSGNAVIPNGSKKSSNVTMSVLANSEAAVGDVYAIPITITSINGEIENSSNYIYLVTAKSEIPSADKGKNLINALYIEVNNESILNAGELTMKSSGKPFLILYTYLLQTSTTIR